MADENNNLFNNTNNPDENYTPAQGGNPSAPEPTSAPQSGQYTAPNQSGQYYSAPQNNPQQYYQPQQNPQNNIPDNQNYYPPQQNTQYNNYQQMPQGNPYYQTPQDGYNPYNIPMQPTEKKANIWLAILSFFIPLVGIILWATQKKEKPKTSKACGIATIISIILNIITLILVSILPSIANTDFSKSDNDDYYSSYSDEYDDYYEDDFYTEDSQDITTEVHSSSDDTLGGTRQGYITKPDGVWANFHNIDYHPESMLGYTNGDIIIIMNYYDAAGYSSDDIRASVSPSIENIKANQTDVAERKDQTYSFSDFYGESTYYVDSTGYKLFTFLFQSDEADDMIYFTIESPTMGADEFNDFVNEVVNTHSFVTHQLDIEF